MRNLSGVAKKARNSFWDSHWDSHSAPAEPAPARVDDPGAD